MANVPRDRLLLVGAAVLAVLTMALFGTLVWRMPDATAVGLPPVELAGVAYVPAAVGVGSHHGSTWAPPPAQTRGRDWIYDTFTPPEIFYHARSRQFTVRPPGGVRDDGLDEPFGVELVAVRPEPFRLQLIGFVGDEQGWRGTFENVLTGEVFLAAAGHRVPKLGVTIVAFDVRKQPVALAQSTTTQQRVATAVIRDDRSGDELIMSHRERRFTGTLYARVAAEGAAGTREVRAGESFKIGDATYRVERVEMNPPSIVITKESPQAGSDRRTLEPHPNDGATAGGDRS